jgi:hypothetical protein
VCREREGAALTTLDLYTRRTDNSDRILRALSDDDPDDEDGPAGVSAAIKADAPPSLRMSPGSRRKALAGCSHELLTRSFDCRGGGIRTHGLFVPNAVSPGRVRVTGLPACC